MSPTPTEFYNRLIKYKIALKKTDEGYSVSVPGLPGCWSQGTTEAEALDNVRDAISSYVEIATEMSKGEHHGQQNIQ